MPARPLRIAVYDKGFVRKAPIAAPKFVTVTHRAYSAGRATVGLLATDRSIPHLDADGARVWIKDEFGNHVMSGWVEDIRGTGPARQALIEVDVVDDFILFSDILGWVIPDATIQNQGTAGEYWTQTGPAETVLKSALQANITRLGMAVAIAPTLGRGSTITAKLRFHPLYDRLWPVVDGSGLEASGILPYVRQAAAGGLEMDVRMPRTYPHVLTEASGIVTGWKFTRRTIGATQVVVGGQGEAQARLFRYYEDAARRAAFGRTIERFRDARDVSDVADLPKRGQETLDEGAAKAGISLELSQNRFFTYGGPTGLHVGDTVHVEVAGQTFTKPLTEAVRSWTQADGWKITPRVGDDVDRPDMILGKAVRAITRHISNRNRT